MKLLFVARNIPLPGYRENDIVLQLVKQLRAQGEYVEVIFPAEWMPVPSAWLSGVHLAVRRLGANFKSDGVNVVVLRYLRLPTLPLSYLLSGFYWPRFKDQRVDIVHAHYALPDGWLALQLSRRANCPLVVTVRQGDVDKIEKMPRWAPVRLMYLWVLRKANLVFSPSASVISQLEAFGCFAKLLPHGVSDTELPRTELTCSQSGVKVLVASTLIPSKRVDWVIKALGAYPGRMRVELTVLGDGESATQLKAMAQEQGVIVDFLGHVSREEVFRHMQNADIFALPSLHETFGLVYLEAALRECAVVATRGTGVDGCFEPESEMLFCAADDIKDFIGKIWSLIEDKSKRQSLAKNARNRAQKDYLWQTVLEKYKAELTAVVR